MQTLLLTYGNSGNYENCDYYVKNVNGVEPQIGCSQGC